MQMINLDTDLLKELIKDSVIEAIRFERFHFIESLIPEVSDIEMQDIINEYGLKPEILEFADISGMF